MLCRTNYIEINIFFCSTYDDAGQPVPTEVHARQGYLEESNVNPVESMMTLMELYRAYEVQQKALQAADQMDNRAANELGKLA